MSARVNAPIFLLGMLALLSACAPLPAPPTAQPPGPDAFIQKRERLASELTGKGNLAEALVQWRVLRLLAPAQPLYAQKIADLTARIKKGADDHMRQAVAALQQGNDEKAEIEFLKVLALDPSHPSPPVYLREIEKRQMVAGLQLKQNGRMYQDAFDIKENADSQTDRTMPRDAGRDNSVQPAKPVPAKPVRPAKSAKPAGKAAKPPTKPSAVKPAP